MAQRGTDSPLAYDLCLSEIEAMRALASELASAGVDGGSEDCYRRAWELVSRLPAGIRRFLDEYRWSQPAAAAVVRGVPVSDEEIGPTPPDWQTAARMSSGARAELGLALLAMALGSPFTWSTLQGGRMIQNVLPTAGEETEQSGHGQVLLEWHTEDGFHPYRCDYLMLLGLRNPDRVATTVSSVRDVALSAEHRRILSEPRFLILPDDEHLRQLARSHPGHPGLARMRAMRDNPAPVEVFFGAPEDPYLRIDPYFMCCVNGDMDAETALKSLISELDRAQQDVVLNPGDVLIVDNYLAVHGRREFKARFDGTDRWLKKIIVTRDLRKSREMRESASSRVIL